MARSSITRSMSIDRRIVRNNYYWPDQQLNLWIIIMLATGGVLIGIDASFLVDQKQLGLGTPWIMPYGITVGSLTVVFILIKLLLIYQRRLLPGVVIIGSFILFVLYLTGLIESAIQVFGAGQINNNCNLFVDHNQSHGVSLNTLAWLEQNATCQSWLALFSFWVVGAVFYIWMIILASMVSRGGLGEDIR